MHHVDPQTSVASRPTTSTGGRQWTPHVIQEDAWDEMDFSRIKQLSNWDSVAAVEILDTTGLSLNEVAQELAKWINSELARTR